MSKITTNDCKKSIVEKVLRVVLSVSEKEYFSNTKIWKRESKTKLDKGMYSILGIPEDSKEKYFERYFIAFSSDNEMRAIVYSSETEIVHVDLESEFSEIKSEQELPEDFWSKVPEFDSNKL